jgi:hypothetical protein
LAEQNLFLQSNTFSNAAWVKTGGTVATGVTDPAGGTTASSFTATALNATLYQTVTLTATPYTESIYIQRVSGVGVINLTLDGVTLSPVVITGSWVKYTYTATPSAGNQTVGIQVVTIGDAINIYGSQIENRSAATATNITTTAILQNYIPQLMTAAINAARFDYNPTTRAALGLLIEQSSTNLLTYSQDFSNSIWGKPNASITANTNIAPDGTQTASQFFDNSTSGLHTLDTATYAAGTYTFSAEFKAGSLNYVGLYSAANSQGVFFNLVTGAFSSNIIGAPTSYTITPIGNNWYRCSITVTTSSSNIFRIITSNNGTSFSYAGTGQYVFIWGAQLEALAFPTSYIPTTSAQVTRAADNASMTGTNFSSWYNPGQGTIYGESSTNAPSTIFNQVTLKITDGTDNNRIQMGRTNASSQSIRMVLVTSGVALMSGVGVATTTQGTFAKTGFSYATNNFFGASNGSLTAITSSGNTPNVNQMAIGYDFSALSYLNGYIKKITYYPTNLSSAQLQALTT